MQVGHSSYVVSLAVVPPGSSPVVPGLGLLSGSRDTTVRSWDIETGQSVCSMSGHKYQVNAVGVLPGGEVVSCGLDGVLKVWKAGKAIRTLEEHDGPILALILLKNGDMLTGAPCVLVQGTSALILLFGQSGYERHERLQTRRVLLPTYISCYLVSCGCVCTAFLSAGVALRCSSGVWLCML